MGPRLRGDDDGGGCGERVSAEAVGMLIVEAGEAIDGLVEKLDAAMAGDAGRQRVVVACARGEAAALAGRLPARFGGLPMLAMPGGPAAIPLETDRVAFLPAAALFSLPPWDAVPADGLLLRPWPLEIPFAVGMPTANVSPVMGWAAPAALLRAVLQEPPESLDLFARPGDAHRRLLRRDAVRRRRGIPAPGPSRGACRQHQAVLLLPAHARRVAVDRRRDRARFRRAAGPGGGDSCAGGGQCRAGRAGGGAGPRAAAARGAGGARAAGGAGVVVRLGRRKEGSPQRHRGTEKKRHPGESRDPPGRQRAG